MICLYISLDFDHNRNMKTLGHLQKKLFQSWQWKPFLWMSHHRGENEILKKNMLSPFILFVRIHYDLKISMFMIKGHISLIGRTWTLSYHSKMSHHHKMRWWDICNKKDTNKLGLDWFEWSGWSIILCTSTIYKFRT